MKLVSTYQENLYCMHDGMSFMLGIMNLSNPNIEMGGCVLRL